MNCQREQSAAIMQKIGELYVLTKDENDVESLVVRPTRSIGPTKTWGLYEDEKLRLALAKYIHARSIPWSLVANEINWMPPAEVFKQIHKFLQHLQGELLSQAVHASASNRLDEPGSSQRRRENWNPNAVVVVEEERASAKRSVPQVWTEEEKAMFEKGIEACGWGSWKLISEKFLPTRTPNQLASHAQKIKKKKQKYDDDDDYESGCGTRSVSPDPSSS